MTLMSKTLKNKKDCNLYIKLYYIKLHLVGEKI